MWNIECTEICKAIRRLMTEEIQAYNEKELLEALEKGKGLKNIKRKPYLGRDSVITLKEDDGTIIRDINRVTKRCEEFCSKLYDTRRP